jgi:hypothetical protein
VPWVVAPDENVLTGVAAALADADRSGAIVTGPDGVGKTLHARLAADRFAARRPSVVVRWVRGTPTERSIPFGAFERLVAVANVGRPAALLRAAHDSLVAGGDSLFVVDDAHELDDLSATLVYQLAVKRSARLIVTARSGTRLPDAVAALSSDELLTRVEVSPPDTHPALPGLVDEYLRGLPPAVRAVLDYLAVAQPLRRRDAVALAGAEAVTDGEARGILTSDGEMVYAGHPLYTDRARADLPDEIARRLRTAVVRQLSKYPSERVSDQLRNSALAIESDGPVPDTAPAAAQALRLGDLALAERLARAAVDRSGGLAAQLVLAHALAWQGRGREAETVLAAVDPHGLSQRDLMAWALPRAANQFWMLGEPERATAFLQTTRNRIDAAAARATLDALAATFAMNAGRPLRGLRIAEEVLAAPPADEAGIGWAASTAALCSARVGRLGDVEARAARALATEHPGLLRFTSGLARITALVMAGRLASARALAQRYTDFAELQQPGRAIGEVLVAYVAVAQGEFDTAAALLGPAADTLARTGYSWGPLSLSLLAQALGQQGDKLAAAKVFRRAESRHGLKSALFAPELALAKAWSRPAHGDSTAAITAAREAMQAAERGGQSAIALRALADAARLGDVRAVQGAQRLSVEVDCVFGRLTLAHARAVTAGDPAALADAAADWADAGFSAAAADAAAQAQRAVTRTGNGATSRPPR